MTEALRAHMRLMESGTLQRRTHIRPPPPVKHGTHPKRSSAPVGRPRKKP